MAVGRLIIIATIEGAKLVQGQITAIGGTAQAASGQVALLGQALGALAAFEAGQALAKYADNFITLENRLGTVTKSTEQLGAVTQALFDISQRSRSDFETTAVLFQRTALAARNFGASATDVLKVSETLNKAMLTFGATSQEARSGIYQLSQALAKGALNGDEMRSVLENIPFVADLIAKEMGVARGALRDLGTQGLVTSKVVFDALKHASGSIDALFAKTVPTFEQSFVVLQNGFTMFFGQLTAATGVTSAFAQVVLFISSNMEIFGSLLLGLIGGVLAILITVTLPGLIALFGALSLAISASPIGLLGILAIAVVSALTPLLTHLGILHNILLLLGGAIITYFSAPILTSWAVSAAQSVGALASSLASALLPALSGSYQALLGYGRAIFSVITTSGFLQSAVARTGILLSSLGTFLAQGALGWARYGLAAIASLGAQIASMARATVQLGVLGLASLAAGALAATGAGIASAAWRAFTLVFSATIVGAIITAIGGIVTALVAFSDQIQIGEDKTNTLWNFFVKAWEAMKAAAADAISYIIGLIDQLIESLTGLKDYIKFNFKTGSSTSSNNDANKAILDALNYQGGAVTGASKATTLAVDENTKTVAEAAHQNGLQGIATMSSIKDGTASTVGALGGVQSSVENLGQTFVDSNQQLGQTITAAVDGLSSISSSGSAGGPQGTFNSSFSIGIDPEVAKARDALADFYESIGLFAKSQTIRDITITPFNLNLENVWKQELYRLQHIGDSAQAKLDALRSSGVTASSSTAPTAPSPSPGHAAVVYVNINTPNADSFKASQDQLLRQMAAAVQTALRNA